MFVGFVELGDHAGEGIADARYLGEPVFGNQLLERQRAQRQVLGGATVGTGAVGIATRQLQPLGQLPEKDRDCCSVEFGHAGQGIRHEQPAHAGAGSRRQTRSSTGLRS
jgi:hypothetical protein